MLAMTVFDKVFMTQDFYDSLVESIDKVLINRWENLSPRWYGYDVIISENPIKDACLYGLEMENRYY